MTGSAYTWMGLALACLVEDMRRYQQDTAGNLLARDLWDSLVDDAWGLCDEMNAWTRGERGCSPHSITGALPRVDHERIVRLMAAWAEEAEEVSNG